MRHSHASLLLEKGVDLATVSERLGHSSIATTAKIYAHALREREQQQEHRRLFGADYKNLVLEP